MFTQLTELGTVNRFSPFLSICPVYFNPKCVSHLLRNVEYRMFGMMIKTQQNPNALLKKGVARPWAGMVFALPTSVISLEIFELRLDTN